jgi:hypothetical protein
MKVIFLDVDGVLNCVDTTDLCGGYVGIENAKVKLLRRIVEATGAEIVLTSTWKDGWSKTDKDKKQDVFGCFLDRELERECLTILDKTEDDGVHRGKGIRDWMNGRDVESFVILDDKNYDYRKCGLSPYHVKTEFYDENGGLNEEHVARAIGVLM